MQWTAWAAGSQVAFWERRQSLHISRLQAWPPARPPPCPTGPRPPTNPQPRAPKHAAPGAEGQWSADSLSVIDGNGSCNPRWPGWHGQPPGSSVFRRRWVGGMPMSLSPYAAGGCFLPGQWHGPRGRGKNSWSRWRPVYKLTTTSRQTKLALSSHLAVQFLHLIADVGPE